MDILLPSLLSIVSGAAFLYSLRLSSEELIRPRLGLTRTQLFLKVCFTASALWLGLVLVFRS